MSTAIVLKPIKEVRPYDRNPRRNDAAVQAVANSIRDFGFNQPIVTDADGVIIAGHTRWKAAKLLGLKEVPVIVAAHLTDEQAQAYRIADNSTGELAEWDADLLAEIVAELPDVDFDQYGLSLEDAEGEPVAASDVVETVPPEPPAVPITRRGDLIILGRHRLLCGDATDAGDYARLMDGALADLMETDPPYNVDISEKNEHLAAALPGSRYQGGIMNDAMAYDAFARFLRKFYSTSSEFIRRGGGVLRVGTARAHPRALRVGGGGH